MAPRGTCLRHLRYRPRCCCVCGPSGGTHLEPPGGARVCLSLVAASWEGQGNRAVGRVFGGRQVGHLGVPVGVLPVVDWVHIGGGGLGLLGELLP